MWKNRIRALIIILLGIGVAYFVYATQIKNPESKYAFHLGLDLSGGSQLVYSADVSQISPSGVKDAMSSLRDVIERRINLFGVSETSVQVEQGSFATQGQNRLIVELPGITDIKQAISMIGQTPLLEFKTERPEGPEKEQLLKDLTALQDRVTNGEDISGVTIPDPYYTETELTGKYLKSAAVDFGQSSQSASGNFGAPVVTLNFDKTGSQLFEKITSENIGKTVAIYLDGAPISAPVVQGAISGGQAVISGNFDLDAAKTLVGRLNSGALPVPISLVSTQSIGPSLGGQASTAGVFAGLVGFIALSVLLILWYRLPGVVAVVSLMIYMSLMFALIKLIPITLTAAGIAGFIISLGLAVDGNILIFERLKEELNGGRTVQDAIKTGFTRAWSSIRDSNFSSILTAFILFWFGSSLIQGFALTLGLGAIMSLVSAVAVSRILLLAFNPRDNKFTRFIFKSGFSK
jgi:preprotein translocase subunit SecD